MKIAPIFLDSGLWSIYCRFSNGTVTEMLSDTRDNAQDDNKIKFMCTK